MKKCSFAVVLAPFLMDVCFLFDRYSYQLATVSEDAEERALPEAETESIE